MVANRLSRHFFEFDTIDVARNLLGQILVHVLPTGQRLSGRIVETEAYLGCEDPAAHSFGTRRTERNEAMYGPPGLAYVYFVYGMHFCMNVVTAPRDVPEAVLIRAVEPIDGIQHMQQAKPTLKPAHLANGPGKLCRALEIARAQNKLDLVTDENLFIEGGGTIPNSKVLEGPRVGIGYAADATHWPLRFGVAGSLSLSPTKFLLEAEP